MRAFLLIAIALFVGALAQDTTVTESGSWVWLNATHNLMNPTCGTCRCAAFWRTPSDQPNDMTPESVEFFLPLIPTANIAADNAADENADESESDDDDGNTNVAIASFNALGVDADAEYYFEVTFVFNDDVSLFDIDFDATEQSPDFILMERGYDALRVVFQTRTMGAMPGWPADALRCGSLSGRWRSAIGGYPFSEIRTALHVSVGDLHTTGDQCAPSSCTGDGNNNWPHDTPLLPSGTATPTDDPTVTPSTPDVVKRERWPYELLYILSAVLACMFAVCICITVRKFCAVVADEEDEEDDSNSNVSATATTGLLNSMQDAELQAPLDYATALQQPTTSSTSAPPQLVPFDPQVHVLTDQFGNVIDPATLPVLPQFVLVAQQ